MAIDAAGHQERPQPLEAEFAWANRAVVVVDVVESVRLVELDEAKAIARWFTFANEIRSILPTYNGRFIKDLGDGMLLDFEEVRSAVAAALAIQQTIDAANIPYPVEEKIQLRIGMEVSDVILSPNDIHGRGVILASRLTSLAGPGEIIASQHVRDRLISTVDAEIDDLGDCFLRHVKEPVRAYRIGPPGPHHLRNSFIGIEELAPAIAVIPFASRTAREDHDVIGEVLAEELIRALSRYPDLNVISRLSTTAFRGRDAPKGEMGIRLNADYLFSGSYRTDDDTVTLEVELAEQASGRILWSDHMREPFAAIISGEHELVDRLAHGVCSQVMAREIQRARLQPLPTLKAYTLLMGAIALMHRLSAPDFEEARRLLQSLLDRGSRHPTPLAWMANWHALRVQQGWSDDRPQDARLALEYTRRALEADPDCSLAFAIEGHVHAILLNQLDVAMRSYESAIATNPNNSLAWLLKGAAHAFVGEGRRAVDDTQRAIRLSPLDPHQFFYESLAATACIADRQYERALELAQRSLRANRKHTSTLRVMTVAQWNLGFFDDARKTVGELMALEPNLTVSGWLKRHPSAAYPVGQEFSNALRQAGVPN
jgi:class 3 adenylate cyclase/TolB-like protein/Tfp pilus assembly protein PilF